MKATIQTKADRKLDGVFSSSFYDRKLHQVWSSSKHWKLWGTFRHVYRVIRLLEIKSWSKQR